MGDFFCRAHGEFGILGMPIGRRSAAKTKPLRAANAQILRMILRQGMIPVWIGLVAGSALSAATVWMLPYVVPIDQR
jgi:hypothetical protein